MSFLRKLIPAFRRPSARNQPDPASSSKSIAAEAGARMAAGDWARAAGLWNELLGQGHHQASAKVYAKLLHCLRKSDDASAMEGMVPKALSAFPADPKVLHEAAAALIALKKWKDAEACLRRFINQSDDPVPAATYVQLGLVLKAGEQFDQAETVLGEAAARFPDDVGIATGLIELAAVREDWSEALTRWREILRAHDDHLPSKAILRMSRTLRQAGGVAAADKIIRHGHALFPEDAEIQDELHKVTVQRQGAPYDMAAWETGETPGTQARGDRITPFQTPAASDCAFIKSAEWRTNPRFIQTLAFGAEFSIETARQTIEWADECRRAWLEGPGEQLWQRLDEAGKPAFIRDLIDRIVKDLLGAIDPDLPVTMGLSGGMDSRGILSSLRRIGASPQTFTFGQIGYSDYDFVSVPKERASLDTILFDTSEMDWKLDEVEAFAPYTQSFPVSPRVPIDSFFNRSMPRRFEINGWLGDALTKSPPEEDMNCTWPDSLPVFNRINNRYQLQCFLPMEEVAAALPQSPLFDPDRIHPIDQLSIGLTEYQRIRPVDRPNVTHVFPFAAREWVGFWLNRTPAERSGQALWLRFLQATGKSEFFEMQGLSNLSRSNLRSVMESLLYGNGNNNGHVNLAAAEKTLPARHHTHFCAHTCYKNNQSFQRLFDFLISRLRKRGIFEPAFIDDIIRHFFARGPNVDRMVDGLLSIDVMLETGWFD